MGERALTTAPEHDSPAVTVNLDRPDNPAVRLLDALRAGDDQALLAAVGQSTTVTAENLPWGCRGPDEVQTMLREARERFPGLTFESSTRHLGFGLVIEEARVRDADFVAPEPVVPTGAHGEATGPGTALVPYGDPATDEPDPTHPMWDDPGAARRTAALALWRDTGTDTTPVALNLPVRVTVRHDDLQVHEVSLSFPAALLKRALGQHVDPLEMSLSEVQSAFIAPIGAGFTTHTLARPDVPVLTPAEPAEEPAATAEPEPPRRRRRGRVLLALLVVAALAAGGWWYLQGRPAVGHAAAPPSTGASIAPAPSPSASLSPSAQPAVAAAPQTVAHTRKPNVTLRSDLAFGFDKSTLSPAARTAVAAVAHQVRKAGLHGTIYVDGYTDNIGSSAYGQLLSQRRADAVAGYLRSHLTGLDVKVVATGHGEKDPVASNATPAGQKQNRRVTITLPSA